MKHLVVALNILLIANLSDAGESEPSPPNESAFEEDIGCIYCLALEIDRLPLILRDQVLRDIICRLSSQAFAPDQLARAVGVTSPEVMQRVNLLRHWGLARFFKSSWGQIVVEAFPGQGELILRRWTKKYCVKSNKCAVEY